MSESHLEQAEWKGVSPLPISREIILGFMFSLVESGKIKSVIKM